MRNPVLGPDRVLLLLSLVPYLREHGTVSVTELADRFHVTPELLRSLVRFLGTAGVPGETLSYQDEDLFDIDWDALELYDEVSLTRTVAVEEAPRFSPRETAALIAGLHALTAVLPDADAELARGIAAKLGTALGGSEPTMSVAPDPEDPRVPFLVAAIDAQHGVQFVYRDASGATSVRSVQPIELTQRAGGWYLRAHCLDRNAERTFRVDQMSELQLRSGEALPARPEGAEAWTGVPSDAEAKPVAPLTAIRVRVAARALPKFESFRPVVLRENSDGSVVVEIEAWHEDTAIRLVQLAPGDATIEAPAAAAAAVHRWAERALANYAD